MATRNKPARREADWTATICQQMRRVGAKVYAVAGNMYGSDGLPDRYVVWSRLDGDGNMFCLQAWLEFKVANGRLSAIQQCVLQDLTTRGVCAVVVRQPNLVEAFAGELLFMFDGTGRDLLAALWQRYADLRERNSDTVIS